MSLSDLVNTRENGGLGLVCISSMGKSLQLRQFLRLMKNGDDKTVGHVLYWMGDILDDFLPPVHQVRCRQNVPYYFESIAHLIVGAKLCGVITSSNWYGMSNKKLYNYLTANFLPTKVAREAGSTLLETWRKLNLFCISSPAREMVYLLIHNKLPTQDRLFRVGLASDPYCDYCLALGEALFCDREHFFCSCDRVSPVWEVIRNILIDMLPQSMCTISNLDLITLNFPKCQSDTTAVWVLGSYLEETWREIYTEGSRCLKRGRLFGFLKYKYRKDQIGSRVQLLNIPELL